MPGKIGGSRAEARNRRVGYREGMLNVAVQVLLLSMVTLVEKEVPEQSPPQVTKDEPESGLADSPTLVPDAKAAVQSSLQNTLGGLVETVPLPVPIN